MASIPFILHFLIIASSSFIIPSSSSAHHHLLPLTHTLTHYPTHSPTHHLLKTSSTRSSTRFRSHRHLNKQDSSKKDKQRQQFSLPLSSGSDYTISLSVDPTTPPISLFMDTGSDLVWFPCHPFQCILCEGKSPHPLPSPPPPPPNSTLVPCSDLSCSAAHSAAPTSDLCSIARCPLEDIETSTCNPKTHRCPRFYYAYGDGSLIAHLRRGRLSLTDSLTFSNFTFACSHSALAEPVGVAGFGRGVLSLPNQLSALSPSLGSRFSYCMISHSFQQDRLIKPSPLILGRAVAPSPTSAATFIYTPILHNPKYPYFYSVGLLGIYVGDKKIVAGSSMKTVDENGNGGMVVDSGTTFTMLPSGLYSKLVTTFSIKMDRVGFKRAVEVEAETGLKPCYHYNERNDSWRVPRLVMEFAGENEDGGRNVSLVEMPRRNYFMGFEREKGKRVGCLMVMDGGDESEEGGGGPVATLGNFQQQGFEVVYDLEEGRVGFARRRCEGLWDELTRV